MNSLVFGIVLSALLSTTSLLVVLFRVSPLSSPAQALTAFFAALFLSVSSVGALLFLALWRVVPLHTWDGGKMLGVSVRQGILLALGTMALAGFHVLGVLTWWIAVMIYMVFAL
ncbi:MAG: hypothetical protein AAB728_05980, partial [Patescibacteria group bacterium]